MENPDASLDSCGPQTKKIILARVISGIDTYGTRYMQQIMGGFGEIALVPKSIFRKGHVMFGNLYTFENNELSVEKLKELAESVSGSISRSIARLMNEASRSNGGKPTCIGYGEDGDINVA